MAVKATTVYTLYRERIARLRDVEDIKTGSMREAIHVPVGFADTGLTCITGSALDCFGARSLLATDLEQLSSRGNSVAVRSVAVRRVAMRRVAVVSVATAASQPSAATATRPAPSLCGIGRNFSIRNSGFV